MRMRKKRWAENEIETNENVIKEAEKFSGKWRDVFANDFPICLEIGVGRGRFIINSAFNNPFLNFIGIEKQASVLSVAARALSSSGVKGNARLVLADGRSIENIFAKNEITNIYINFCDPWEKSRHEKRRLTHSNFLCCYRNVLNIDGKLILKTDNKKLFDFSIKQFIDNGWEIKEATIDLHGHILKGLISENIMTEYEEKFIEKGEKIYRICASPISKKNSLCCKNPPL